MGVQDTNWIIMHLHEVMKVIFILEILLPMYLALDSSIIGIGVEPLPDGVTPTVCAKSYQQAELECKIQYGGYCRRPLFANVPDQCCSDGDGNKDRKSPFGGIGSPSLEEDDCEPCGLCYQKCCCYCVLPSN